MSKTKEFVFRCEHMGGATWTVEHQWAIEGEAEEVVRCKDCKFVEQNEGRGEPFCLRMCFVIDDEGLGFCAWGKRRDA